MGERRVVFRLFLRVLCFGIKEVVMSTRYGRFIVLSLLIITCIGPAVRQADAATWVTGSVPDWNQPLWHGANGPNGGPSIGSWNAWCVPTAAANMFGHMEDVNNETNMSDGVACPGSGVAWPNWPVYQDYQANGQSAGGQARGTLSPGRVDDLGWYMDTNDRGDPNQIGGGGQTGTCLQNISPQGLGLNKFLADVGFDDWSACTHGRNYRDAHTQPHPTIADGFAEVKNCIDMNCALIVSFQHWSLKETGLATNNPAGNAEAEAGWTYYTFDIFTNTSDGELSEVWTDSDHGEAVGHAVTAVGYIEAGTPYDIYGDTDWVIVHDNWSQTPRNVAVPYGQEWTANTVLQYHPPIVHDIPDPGDPKWDQEWDTDYGIALQSWTNYTPQHAVADDWLCDGRPIVGIRWWGAYLGWEDNDTNPADPTPTMRPSGFEISWYTDAPAGTVTNYGTPGTLVTNIYVGLASFGVTNASAGMATELYAGYSDLDFVTNGMVEHAYEYQLELQDGWLERRNQTYWLRIQACYGGESTETQWAWKTATPEKSWGGGAVSQDSIDSNWQLLTYPPDIEPWDSVTNHPYEGEPVQMAFELFTDVDGRRAKKWLQDPDMVNGTDMSSWRREDFPVPNTLRADDFVSDGRRITDIHWWGSYINWLPGDEGTIENPVPPPGDDDGRPLGFDISWHQHNEAECLPGMLITNVFVPIDGCHEMFYGSVYQGWLDTAGYEHEYEYFVDLLDTNLFDGPWYEEEGVHYWLNIQAVFPGSFDPEIPLHDGWGWKITPETNLCTSVISSNGGAWYAAQLPVDPDYPRSGELFDLAFYLTTDGVGTNDSYEPITISNLVFSGNNLQIMSFGDAGAGVQVLQYCSDLMTTNWTDVVTNSLPLWPPHTNYWWHNNALSCSNGFYRIMQR